MKKKKHAIYIIFYCNDKATSHLNTILQLYNYCQTIEEEYFGQNVLTIFKEWK